MQVFDKTAKEIGDMVAAGIAEFGVTLLGADRWNLAAYPLMKDEFLCVCPADHPLAARPTVRWRDLEISRCAVHIAENVNRIVMDKGLEKQSESCIGCTRSKYDYGFNARARRPCAAASELPHKIFPPGLKA